MPDLDDLCSRHFRYRDLVECGKTWSDAAAGGARIPNVPLAAESWAGLRAVATVILDPIVEEFGSLTLTYGFAGSVLARKIARRIAPQLDQHAGSERNRRGRPVCSRGGQAVDLLVPGTSSARVAAWIVTHLPFDRLYFYGPDRPLHVSVAGARQKPVGSIVMVSSRTGQPVPRRVNIERFLADTRDA